METVADRRFIMPMVEYFGTISLGKIAQADIDDAAAKLYPGVSHSTLNRQIYTPFVDCDAR